MLAQGYKFPYTSLAGLFWFLPQLRILNTVFTTETFHNLLTCIIKTVVSACSYWPIPTHLHSSHPLFL